VGQGIIIALTLISTPFMTRKLGSTQYGAFSLLMTYLFAFSLLNLGINTSLVKYMAELIPQGRSLEIQKYFSTSLTVLLGIGALIGVVVYVLAPPIVRMCFKGPAELGATVVLALRIASMAFVLQFLCQVLSAVPAAAQRFEILNLVRTSFEAFRILGTVTVLLLGGGLPSLMAIVLLASLGTCAAYAIAAKRLLPAIEIRLGFSLTYLRSLIRHSKYIVLTNASSQAVSTVDNFLIGYFLPVANIAYYGIAYAIAQRLWTFVANIVSVVFPAASSFAAAEQDGRLKELYIRGMKIMVAIGGFPAFAVAIFSRPFLLLWLGPEYASQGASVLSLLTIGFLINSFSYVAYQVLQSTHHAVVAARGAVVYMLLNIGLFCVLIPRHGILGAALAFLMAQFLFVPWFIGKTNRLMGLRWRSLARLAFLPGLVCTSASALACLAMTGRVHSYPTLALAAGVGFFVHAAVGARLVLDARDRSACQLLVRRWTSLLREGACQR
jgi:O-antigen/teichoic acid export membrane protein